MKPAHIAAGAALAGAAVLDIKLTQPLMYKRLKKSGEKAKYTYGMPGDCYHITSNKKLSSEEKDAVVKEIKKDGYRQYGEAILTSGAVGVGAGVATLCSKNVKNFFAGLKNTAANFAGRIKYNDKSLRETVANSGIYKKFKTLPAPVKAAIGAAGALSSLFLVSMPSALGSRAAYIEAQHENKQN